MNSHQLKILSRPPHSLTIPSATSLLVTHLSIACFSIYRWAWGSSMFFWLISSHLARFTSRISAIFSSTDKVFVRIFPERSLALAIHPRAWMMVWREVGFGRVKTPCFTTLSKISSWISDFTNSSTAVSPV